MVWKWAYKKHKSWGKKIANYYFLNEKSDDKDNFQIQILSRMRKYKKKYKGLIWVFSKVLKTKLCHFKNKKNEKRNYLYSVIKEKITISALIYNIPVALRKIYAYHPQRLKLIE